MVKLLRNEWYKIHLSHVVYIYCQSNFTFLQLQWPVSTQSFGSNLLFTVRLPVLNQSLFCFQFTFFIFQLDWPESTQYFALRGWRQPWNSVFPCKLSTPLNGHPIQVKSLILVKIFPEILEESSKYTFIIVAKIQWFSRVRALWCYQHLPFGNIAALALIVIWNAFSEREMVELDCLWHRSEHCFKKIARKTTLRG